MLLFDEAAEAGGDGRRRQRLSRRAVVPVPSAALAAAAAAAAVAAAAFLTADAAAAAAAAAAATRTAASAAVSAGGLAAARRARPTAVRRLCREQHRLGSRHRCACCRHARRNRTRLAGRALGGGPRLEPVLCRGCRRRRRRPPPPGRGGAPQRASPEGTHRPLGMTAAERAAAGATPRYSCGWSAASWSLAAVERRVSLRECMQGRHRVRRCGSARE